jgi:dolichol kinase
VRYFALWPFGVSVHLFLNEFLDSKDSGTAILSHFYLLAGCASPLWLEGSEVLSYFGVLVLGIGDALVSCGAADVAAKERGADGEASIVGRRVGKVKWCAAGGKTVEGSVAFVGSVLVSTMFLWAFGFVKNFNVSAGSYGK